jgi:hypothetical protein
VKRDKCPCCGGSLDGPEDKGCGYCRALRGQEAVVQAVGEPGHVQVAAQSAAAVWNIVGAPPRWMWLLAGGVLVLAGGALAVDALLPSDSFPRALCSTLGLVVGVLVLLGAQIYGVMKYSAEDSALGTRQFFLPSPRLWKYILKDLPATRWLVYFGTWGLTSAICAVVIVGDLFYWAQHFHPPSFVDRDLRQAAESQDRGKEFTAPRPTDTPPPKTEQTPVEDVKADPRPTVQCAIIGYIPDEAGRPTTLILARLSGGKLNYCGNVTKGILPEEADDLRERLAKLVRAEPIIPGLQQKAVWVKAGAYCDVHQSGTNAQGNLVAPSYNGLRLK